MAATVEVLRVVAGKAEVAMVVVVSMAAAKVELARMVAAAG